ncbi:MAG TPA: serine hydrolase domain-containing protein [Gemmatimonadales bacterium]|nr:serine hydrolase domain-containing protein [Gemmatimonadales bacterium]
MASSVVGFAILAQSLAAHPGTRALPPPPDSINAYIAAEMSRQRIPGLSLAILRGDSVMLARGYGFANVELRVPASDSTIYQSGSVGKQFTAAMVVMLSQQGRFRLDDPVTRWLPEGAGVWDSITVRHLLTHTSGVGEYTDSTFDYRKDYTEDELVRFAASRPLDFPPGARWSYSNTGYLLLGVLVHRVTGRFYGDVLRDLIFRPLGMGSARIISEADIVPNRAAGYELVKGRLKNQEWVAPSLNTTADGSLYLSLNDMIPWAVSLNQGRIPDSTVLRAAWQPVRLKDGGLFPYGFGWDLTDQRGHRRIGHTGAWQGFKTAIHRYPEYQLTVIVLANLASAETGSLAEGVAGIVEPDLRPPPRFTAALPGPRPPQGADRILQQLAGGRDAELVTPGLHRFLSPAVRTELGQLLKQAPSWTSLGCDVVSRRKMVWLGAPIERACYSRGIGPAEQVIVTTYYTRDWKVAHLNTNRY